MRVSVGNQQFEVRIQERKVTIVDIMQNGRRLSRGMAIQNPKDEAEGQIDPKTGIQLAAMRATAGLTLKPMAGMLMAQKILRQFEAGIERRKRKALAQARVQFHKLARLATKRPLSLPETSSFLTLAAIRKYVPAIFFGR